MHSARFDGSFSGWRQVARQLLATGKGRRVVLLVKNLVRGLQQRFGTVDVLQST